MEDNLSILGIINIQNQESKNLTSVELSSKEKVIEVFDLCQILHAAILPHGWKFLFKNYGLKGIIEIDKESQWLDDEDMGEWIKNIYYQSFISGYNPIHDEFCEYDENTGISKNKKGALRKIDWKSIYYLKNSI